MKTVLKCLLIVFVTAFVSCSHKMAFQRSTVVPGASGKVAVSKDGNDNYQIAVNVKDLTEPKNLVPAKQTYVVWNESNDGVKSLGQLNTGRSFLHRGYKASLDALSTVKPKRVFITAEDDANTQSPSAQIVLTTE